MIVGIFGLLTYKIAPIWTGTAFLHDHINKQPRRKQWVPMPTLRKVATHAYMVISNLKKPLKYSAMQEAVEYVGHLEYCSMVIEDIIENRIDMQTAKTRHAAIASILEQSP